MNNSELIPIDHIENAILLIRGLKVMLDRDLARLYKVPTHRLNEAVKRNNDRFPVDFMFQLTDKESALISQFAISKTGRGGRRTLPYAFTEQGVAMLSSVLRSDRAVLVNIAIMRAFVRLRATLSASEKLAKKLAELERVIVGHDENIRTLFTAIRKLMEPPQKASGKIGFDPSSASAER